MAKKMKKKIRFKIIPIFVFLVIVVALYFVFSYLLDTKIKNIYVYGNKFLSDQEIIELAQIDGYPSFYKTMSRNIKNGIKTNTLIKSVKVKKTYFNVLKIYIEEYQPLFMKGDKIVLENAKEIKNLSLKLPVLNSDVVNDTYIEFIEKMANIDPNIRSQISEIIYSPNEYDKTRFLMYMDDGNHVYVNLIKFSNLNYYNDIYPSLNNKKGTLYLDSGNHFEVFK